jgi:hypothetical protein
MAALQRVLLVADCENGEAAVAEPNDLLNTDSHGHLHRELSVAHELLNDETAVHPLRMGVVNTRLGDELSRER